MKKFFVMSFAVLFAVTSASAHFLMMYTPEPVVEDSEVAFKIVFTHPFDAGHTMNIGENEKGEIKGLEHLFITHKGKTIDAADKAKKVTFTSLENSGEAYEFMLNKDSSFRGGGDWALVGVPAPYYEGSEDIYIQQVTKMFINKGDLATDWNERVAEGYPEILPFVKPYAVWAGGVFRGMVVDGAGKPVPNAEIEVEYINYDVDMKANKFTGSAKIKKEGHGAAVIIADDNGNFSFVPSRKGYWGFAALGAGGEKTFNGKELSLDAVLWIYADDIK